MIAEVNRITNIHPLVLYNKWDRSYLIMLEAYRIPPHFMFGYKNQYYNLGVNGVQSGYSIHSLLRIIERKKIPSIFFTLNHCEQDDTELIITKSISKYKCLSTESIYTCFTPITEIINKLYRLQLNKNQFAFDILPILLAGNFVQSIQGVNILASDFKNGVALKPYTRNDINEMIVKTNA